VLLDYTVRNPAGDELGELEDLMVNWREGRVAYAVLSLGGFLGMGDKWFAVPLSALTINPVEQTVVIDVDREMLQVAPGFDRDNWPDVANPDWDQEIRQYWEEWLREQEQLQQPPVGEPGVLPDVPDVEDGTPEAPATPSQ
jgi:sporulation protein YlmC with PRC-barrel domain